MSSIFRVLQLLVYLLAYGVALAASGEPAEARSFERLQHTGWTIADGAPPDVWALAQTSDGYLWLGTGDGLYRFDGVRFERIEPSDGSFPHTDIVALHAMANDDLFIGYQNGGVSLLTKGRLRNFSKLPDATVSRIIEDGARRVWVLSYTTLGRGGLMLWDRGRWARFSAGLPASVGATDMAVDPHGTVWLLVDRDLYYLPLGRDTFLRSSTEIRHPPSPSDKWGRIAFGSDSSLWLARLGGVFRVTAGEKIGDPPSFSHEHGKVLIADDGSLWTVTAGSGILRVGKPDGVRPGTVVRSPEADLFSRRNGLTSNIVGTLFEDREKNIWVGTNLGLDRFHTGDVIQETAVDPTSRTGYRMAPAPGNAFYLVQSSGLYELTPGRPLTPLQRTGVRPDGFCAGSQGMLWLASERDFRRWSGRTSKRVELPNGTASKKVTACQEDELGRLWLAVAGKGIFRRDKSSWKSLPSIADPSFDGPVIFAADRDGAMWVSVFGHSLRLVIGDVVRSFRPKDAPQVGDIEVMYSGPAGMWVGGDTGLAWFDGRRFRSATSDPTSPFRRIAGIIQTKDGRTWLNTLSGVVETDTEELRNTLSRGRWPSRYRVFDRHDGLPGLAQQDSYAQTVLRGNDGRLWFITNQGVAWIDPGGLLVNRMPPPVIIQTLAANGVRHAGRSGLQLPAGTSNIEIDYTAPSLRIPERVAFRYNLEGVDNGWIDPGKRRQAFYTRLGPGEYVFRVTAANESGIWNGQEAQLRFSILPKFTETPAFFIACAIGAGLAVIALFLFNIRRMSARLRERLNERLRERERIARELHDTLIQGFQGLQLHFQAAVETLPSRSEARDRLESALSLADGALGDARRGVRDLRAGVAADGLPKYLRTRGDRLLDHQSMSLQIEEKGSINELDPAAEREIAAVAEEAIFNAVKHAEADRIDVCIAHSWRKLRLIVSDSGKGIGEAASAAPSDGHFGLLGMRERARRLKGTLTIRTGRAGGTEVQLTVPGSIAYGRFSWLLGRSRPRG